MEVPALVKNDEILKLEKEKQEKYQFKEMPKIEDYLTPLTPGIISNFQKKFEQVFNLMKTKLEKSKSSLFIKPEEITMKSETLKPLFTFANEFDSSSDKKYQYIIDAKDFINYAKTPEEVYNIKEAKKVDQELLNNLFNKSLEERGTLILLLDFQFLLQMKDCLKIAIGDNFKTKLFVKIYVVENLPLVTVLVMQKMGPHPTIINYNEIKFLIYEMYSNLEVSKPQSSMLVNIGKHMTYFYELYQYQGYLSELHEGQANPINIKLNPCSENIDYTLTIVDTTDKELIDKKTICAIIISKAYATDFLYLTIEGNLSLCKQTESTRILLIRPAPFNNKSTQEIKSDMQFYIAMFKYKECTVTSIPVMLIQDENLETYEIYKDDNLVIQDVVVNANKDTFRQLIFNSNLSEVESEIKLKLSSKTNIKKDEDNKYIPLPTHSKYSKLNLVSCFDDSVLCMFYIKSIIVGLFFANFEKFPEENLKILVLGGGIGTINYYLNKILKGNVTIDSVELSKKVTELGDEYFGFNNLKDKKKNMKWYFQDARQFILDQNNKDNYYDLIVIDINNTNNLEGICPPSCFFEDKVISKIFKMLKQNGMYIINLMARSYQMYLNCFNSIQKYFPVIYLIQNNEDLNKIHFCWKNKYKYEEILEIYEKNIERFAKEQIIDIEPIRLDHLSIAKRLMDTENFKKNLQTYIQ